MSGKLRKIHFVIVDDKQCYRVELQRPHPRLLGIVVHTPVRLQSKRNQRGKIQRRPTVEQQSKVVILEYGNCTVSDCQHTLDLE